MNSFEQARTVEARSLYILLPYLLEETAGRLVVTQKGPLAPMLQETVGDLLMNKPDGRLVSAELKAEKKFTGNLFIETWSNKNLENRADHAAHGSNPGWSLKLRADLLLYHFLDADALYMINLFRLQQWAFGANGNRGQIYNYPEVRQNKYDQKNDTWGRLVKISDIERYVGLKLKHPKQLIFDFAEEMRA